MDEPRVVFEDGDLVVVDKPSGMLVHPAGNPDVPDLIAWLSSREGLPAALPAHRLDVATSGLVLCAASPERRAMLGEHFASGTVHKTYLALVVGHARKKGTIDRPLRDARRRTTVQAVTRYWLHEALGGFSLLRVRPETGRKHQIRRHLSGIGLPIVGDERWGPRRRVRVPAWPGRLWLHAWRLELPDGETFEAPLPEALERNLAALRAGRG